MNPVVLPSLRYRRLWFGAGVAIAVVVAVLSLMPGRHVPEVNVSDKFKHFAAFAMLAFWFGSIMVRPDLPLVGLAVVGFGGLIEIAQGMMGLGRHADWYDMLADTLGVLLGMALVLTPLGNWARWLEARVARARA